MDAQCLELGLDPLGVPQQQIALLTRLRVPKLAVGLVGAHLLDPDAHSAQARQCLQRVEVLIAAAAVPATRVALDRPDQPDLFIVPQRRLTQSAAPGDILDGEGCHGTIQTHLKHLKSRGATRCLGAGVLRGLHTSRGAQAIECGLQDWFEVAGLSADRRDGDDHVEDLLEGEVVADLVSPLRGGEERSAGDDYSGTVAIEKGIAVSGPGSAARLRRFPGRYDASDPANAAKLDAADALGALADEAGLTLIQMAVAFVTRHRAVTSAIIGPRTTEHLDTYLAADGIDLSSDVLDRIDEIVPPGVTINVADNMWEFGTTALDAAFRRR